MNAHQKTFPLVVEKGFPLPSDSRGRPGGKYPFATMEVGDSFHMPAKDHAEVSNARARISASAKTFRKSRPDVVFATRKVDGGIRVWRIA